MNAGTAVGASFQHSLFTAASFAHSPTTTGAAPPTPPGRCRAAASPAAAGYPLHIPGPQQLHHGPAAPGPDRQLDPAVADDPHTRRLVTAMEQHRPRREGADLQGGGQRGHVSGPPAAPRRVAAGNSCHPSCHLADTLRVAAPGTLRRRPHNEHLPVEGPGGAVRRVQSRPCPGRNCRPVAGLMREASCG